MGESEGKDIPVGCPSGHDGADSLALTRVPNAHGILTVRHRQPMAATIDSHDGYGVTALLKAIQLLSA